MCDGGDTLLDPDGREIADESRIAGLALKEARTLIGHDALDGGIRLDQSIEVRDEAGKLIHRINFRDAVTID